MMDGSNGNEADGKVSPTPCVSGDKVAILDAGAQYGKVSYKSQTVNLFRFS